MENKIAELIKKMKGAGKYGDWEGTHSYYDQIINLVAKKHEPALMKKLGRITKDYTWWFA